VLWNSDEIPTINQVNQNPLVFAKNISNTLEAAYHAYFDGGYAVAPSNQAEANQQQSLHQNVYEIGITWVVIDTDLVESYTGSWTGISL